MFKEVRTRDLTFNVFETIAYEWGVVTMQDEGVSKLLELRASEIEQKLGMDAAK